MPKGIAAVTQISERQRTAKLATLRRVAKNAQRLATALENIAVDVHRVKTELYPDYQERAVNGREGYFVRFFETVDQAERLMKWSEQAAKRALSEEEICR